MLGANQADPAAAQNNNGLLGAHFPLEQWFYELPICTRTWTTATVLVSILVQCRFLTPFQLFYSYRAVFVKRQVWRLLTTFCYFGPLSLDLIFHVFFLQRYARLLEEEAGGLGAAVPGAGGQVAWGGAARFSWLLAYAASALVALAPVFGMPFLGSALSSTLVYIWARKNPETRLSIFGLLVFRAPFLPWVLIVFSLVMHGSVPKDELCGAAVGHVWYFFNDVYPSLHDGHRPLDPPAWWCRLWEGRPQDHPHADEDLDMHNNATGAEPVINRDIAAAGAGT
ncbi:Der1-like family-domain-containing protein [Lineolata rhizophorae]|uniref:Derlin n=1 Tax=Lineolata rhizophorae TaxID=578093 RepID=A0A6A6NZS8_9PEZI|nr:Der1-like family-domain-containing protein [Lineolata rhizophorae]